MSFLARLIRRKHKPERRLRERRGFSLAVERLEDRSLMAATVSASLSAGVLTVNGTEAADTISVRQVNNYLSVSGLTGRYSVSQVKQIVVNGLGGNDRILLNSEATAGQQPILLPTLLNGGAGSDYIVGSAGSDQIVGGLGNDQLLGGGGNDLLDGRDNFQGRDTLSGGAGDDRLLGETGYDSLDGGAGQNRLDWFIKDDPARYEASNQLLLPVTATTTALLVTSNPNPATNRDYYIKVDNEVMLVGYAYGGSLTVYRGQLGTVAQAHSVGATVTLYDPQARLTAPTLIGPGGTLSDAQPTFQWNPVAGATSYELFVARKDNNPGLVPLIHVGVNGTSYRANVPLADGVTYTWYVVARSGSTFSPWSAGRDVTFRASPLAAPTLFGPIGNILQKQPTFGWNPVAGATSYDVWVDDVTAGTRQVLRNASVTGTSWTASTPLTPGHSYQWWVKAKSSNGQESLWSAPSAFTVALAPDGPVVTATAVSPTQINVTWRDVAGETGYRVLLNDGSGYREVAQLPRDTTSHSIVNLAPGTTYWVTVEARNQYGPGHSQAEQVQTPVAPPTSKPAAPGGFSARAASGTVVDLSWNDVTGEDGYVVYCYVNGAWQEIGRAGRNATSYQVINLKPDTAYWFCVGAFNSKGPSYSNSDEAFTGGPVQPQMTWTAEAVDEYMGVFGLLHWNDVAHEDGYRIWWKRPGDTQWYVLANLGANETYYELNLHPGTTTYFCIEALSGNFSSPLGSNYYITVKT
jgi:hypothetical protein